MTILISIIKTRPMRSGSQISQHQGKIQSGWVKITTADCHNYVSISNRTFQTCRRLRNMLRSATLLRIKPTPKPSRV